MTIPGWFLPPTDPKRLADEARQLRLIRELEAAATRAGIQIRPKVIAMVNAPARNGAEEDR